MPIFVFLSALLLFCGCTNFSTLQTARTVKPGQSRVTIGGGAYAGESVDAFVNHQTGGVAQNLFIPYAEVNYREGISPSLDWGGRITIPGTVALDLKYQWVDHARFAAAVGGYFGYMVAPYNVSLMPERYLTRVSDGLRNYFDLVLPLYFSYDVSAFTSFYLSPKYLGRFVIGGAEGQFHAAACSLGVKYGRREGILFEVSYFNDLRATNSLHGFQLSAGFFFGSAVDPKVTRTRRPRRRTANDADISGTEDSGPEMDSEKNQPTLDTSL